MVLFEKIRIVQASGMSGIVPAFRISGFILTGNIAA